MMDDVEYKGFDVYFSKLTDPRISRKKLYPLIEVLFVVLCGSICGAESWRDFVLFGKEKIDLLREYYPFTNGIASKDTFVRVFAVLDPEAFKSCFVSWVKSLQSSLHEVIAIDGKTLCNSFDLQNDKPAIQGKTSTERRFFISNLPPNAKQIANAVRAHWMVENNLHWTLDVVFNEDESRVRKDHAGENMAIVRHIVINILNKAKDSFKGVGLKALRKKAGWGNTTLSFILKQSLNVTIRSTPLLTVSEVGWAKAQPTAD